MPRRETLVVKTHRASLSNIQLVLDVFGRYHDVASAAPSVGSLADEALLRRLWREWRNARSNLGSDICYHIATHCAPPANRPEGTGGRRCAEMLRAWLRSSERRFVFVGHLSRRARAVPLFAFGLPESPAVAVHAVADAAAEVHVVLDVVRRDRPVTGRAPVPASVAGVHLRQALSRQAARAQLTEDPVARFGRQSHCELR